VDRELVTFERLLPCSVLAWSAASSPPAFSLSLEFRLRGTPHILPAVLGIRIRIRIR
jgi:hypothetical protein